MDKEIIYYKLAENEYYQPEINTTKGCALNGTEFDQNFHTLEGMSIKSFDINQNKIAIKTFDESNYEIDVNNITIIKNMLDRISNLEDEIKKVYKKTETYNQTEINNALDLIKSKFNNHTHTFNGDEITIDSTPSSFTPSGTITTPPTNTQA